MPRERGSAVGKGATSGTGCSSAAWKGARMTGLYQGTWWGRHKDERDTIEDDRFGTAAGGRVLRVLREGPELGGRDVKRLAERMTSDPELPPTQEGKPDPEEDPDITAAYTYLGQFTDHDLTFDPTSRLREALTGQELDALADFRTPGFDVDNLTGRGPDDQPHQQYTADSR